MDSTVNFTDNEKKTSVVVPESSLLHILQALTDVVTYSIAWIHPRCSWWGGTGNGESFLFMGRFSCCHLADAFFTFIAANICISFLFIYFTSICVKSLLNKLFHHFSSEMQLSFWWKLSCPLKHWEFMRHKHELEATEVRKEHMNFRLFIVKV